MTSENQSAPGAAAAPSEGFITLPSHAGAPVTDAAKSVPMTSPPDRPPRDWFDKVDWVLLGLVVALAALVSSVPAFNADVWIHLAAGKLITAGEYLPGSAEPFSCATDAGAARTAIPWINHSWLYDLGLYLLYAALGGMAVIIAKACVIGLLTIALALIRTRDTHLFIVAICLTLTVLALSLRLLLQPVIVSYLFLGVTLLILHRAGVWDRGEGAAAQPDRARGLWVLPGLCLVWVNCDNWFILGPIVVGLAWAGALVQRWRGWSNRVTPGRLGVIFAACLVACLINPFHVRAFQLPPELAYLLVRAGDRIGVPLPDALVAGGRTLRILHEETMQHPLEPPLVTLLSPFAESYWSSPTLGYTIAGVCFYPLLGLGLLSFLVNGWLGGKPGGPVLQPARFLIWLFFAVLASLLQRLIPFFVIVAGPILALNLGDLLSWCTRSVGAAGEGASLGWDAPVRLGRLVGVLVLVALLLLAWPGWLTGPQEIGARLHAGWDIPVNESLRLAAEQLGESPGPSPLAHPARVFGMGLDFASYCAYFAGPAKAKGFMDTRYNLYPQAAADFVKARRALLEKQRRPMTDWTSVFDGYRLDHVAVDNADYSTWWAEPGRWLERWADRAVAIFAWSGPQPHWPGDAVLEGWNRLAFGAVAPRDQPPADGVPAPVNRTLLDRYLEPPPALPQPALDMDVKLAYGNFVTRRVREMAQLTLPSGVRAPVLPMYSLPLLPLAPGAMIAPWAMCCELSAIEEHRYKVFFWSPTELLPPAVPILALRRAWQTVAAAPGNERSYIHLADALSSVQQQEDLWANLFGPPPLTLRAELRRVQMIAARRAATEVGFTHPALQYQVYHDLALEYLKRHALDLSAEYLDLAAAAAEAVLPEDPNVQEDWRKARKELAEHRKQANAEVKRRKSSFELKVAGRQPMDKIREALQGVYRSFTPDNREEIDPQGWGLTGLALQMLDEVDPATLPPQERSEWGFWSIDLMFKIGRAREASQLLTQFETPLGALALRLHVFRAGTQGNYRALRQALQEGDDLLTAQTRKVERLTLGASAGLLAAPGPAAPAFSMGGPLQHWLKVVNDWRSSANEAFNSKTLHGIIALEAGATAEARRLFAEVLREAGSDFYDERAIAEHYATLLERYQPR